MIDTASIELWSQHFWLTFLAAFLLLYPSRNFPAIHKLLWALVNISFIVILFNDNALLVLLFIAAAQLGLYAFRLSTHRRPLLILAILSFSGIFILYRLPYPLFTDFQTRINPLLQLLGFGYVYLRLIEQYRAVSEPHCPIPDIFSTINYLIPFHMLAAGPIQSWQDYTQYRSCSKPLTVEQCMQASEMIIQGLFKKFVLAALLQEYFLTGYQSTGWYLFVEIQLVFIWLYLDFSAYSNIAKGIGLLLHMHTPENFNRPWLARNLIDFWERWHISLSQWIRRNLFLPVQYNLMRYSRGRFSLYIASISFLLSFFLCGIWHGTGLNYMLWGLLHASGLICVNVYRHFLRKYLDANKMKHYMNNLPIRILANILTFEYVALSLIPVFQLPGS